MGGPRRLLVAAALGMLCGAFGLGDEPPAVIFDQAKDPDGQGRRISLRDAEVFEVRVINSNDKQCSLKVTGISLVKPEPPPGREARAGTVLSEKVIHDAAFGGYYARVKCSEDVNGVTNRLWLIFVRQEGWTAGFGGGFTVSALTDPVFETRREGADMHEVVRRDKTKESEARLGFGAFVHVYDSRIPLWSGAAFGLGIKDDSKTNYFIGSGIRLGDQGFVTLGLNWGPVDRLPNGIRDGDTLSDTNALSSLPTRTRARVFVALSYTFIDIKSFLTKPFAAEEQKK